MDIAIYSRAMIFLILSTCVPLLMYIGFKLFVMGAKGEISITHKSGGDESKLTNLSPGAFCFLLSIVLSAYLTNATLKINPIPNAAKRPDSSSHNDSQSETVPEGIEWFVGKRAVISEVLLEEYALLGMCLHSYAQRPPGFTSDSESCFDDIKMLVKRPVSVGSLKDLKQYEHGALNGNETAVNQLKAWKFDNLKEKSK